MRSSDCGARGREYESEWNSRFERYAKAHAGEAAEFKSMLAGELPSGWDAELPQFTPKDTLATRESASRAEQAIAKKVWNLFGGAADLNESTFTNVKDGGDFERGNYAGRNLHFGIREHGMCAILNGIALHGGFIPYGSSFFVFTDYCRPSIRLAALMELLNALGELNAEPGEASAAEVFAVGEAVEALVVMLAPFAPHVAEEMWEGLGHEGGLARAALWPVADPELARKEELEIPVQVNGKLRSRVVVAPDISETDLRTIALADPKVQSFIDGHEIVKVIVVPQRLVNVVVKK